MSMSVGVHENVQFSKATKNDKGTLVVGFKKQETNKLAALSSGKFEPDEQDLLIFPPQMTEYGGEQSTSKQMQNKIQELLDTLEHIAFQFMTKDKVRWDLFANTGITEDNYDTKMTSQDTITKIYNNIVEQFNNMMKPFVNSTKLFRVVFVRTSKAKHYPKLRSQTIKLKNGDIRKSTGQPFIEPMEINPPKVKFTPWEIENGYDNPNPVGGAQTANATEAAEADSLFANTIVQ